tara:strand:- start:1870 stop:2733 length:864 start_codon:yes stop_codon:yes gene_type:complete
MLNSFFDINDLSKSQLEAIIYNKVPKKNLKDKQIGCLYEKPSTRTRLSFAVGINQLLGSVIDIKFEELNFSREESFEDTFRAMGCYLDGLIFRTSSHEKLLLGHKYMNKPIINALSDKSHPCQILSDLITLYENFKTLEIEISWFGDFNNVLFSLVQAVNLLDSIKLNIFSHISYIKKTKWIFGNNINIYDELDKTAISRSNCIMTDVFISMNDQTDKEKINLLKKFQVNNNIMQEAQEDCIFMHCLPAKIGLEVTKDVIESSQSVVWKQAANRLPAQMRLMKCINW